MNNFCVIDIETAGLSARPESFIFGCVYAENFRRVFHDRKEMVSFLFSRRNPFKYIFAHNGEYDFTCLFDNIILNLDNGALFVGSTFISARSHGKVFCNSLTILKSSVQELGKNLGLNKMNLDDKFKNAKPGDKIKVTEYDIEYCFTDCEIIYHFLTKVFSYTKKIKFTIASCAMEIFTKEFLKRKLKRNPLNEKFRASYYGGRVECFRFGNIKPIYKYDINSLYPYVCTKMYFPDFNKLKQGKKCTTKYFSKFVLPNYEGCALVMVKHKNNFVGTLPYRREHEIIFPVGTYQAWYNFNELRNSISTGMVEILSVSEYVYAPKIIFTELREYMLHFYKKKNETTGAEKMINKFFLNALTGKFAQKEYGKKRYFESPRKAFQYKEEQLRFGNKVELHHFGEDRDDLFVEVFHPNRKRKINWNIPTISSYITSEARIVMLDYFLKHQNNICYTDTDSLVITKPLPLKMTGDLLGQFKKEDDEEITIIGNKHYYSKAKGRKRTHYIKGVSKNFKAKKIRSGEHKGKQGFFFTKMVKTKESISRNLHAGMFVEVVKHMANDYTKRVVSNNKTKSLKLSEA